MKELEMKNTTTMVKVVASLPILTKEGSLMIQQQINEMLTVIWTKEYLI